MQINNNVAALNAWRNLGVSSNALGKSLEKLSSGYRINRGADDPAGLLISEQLRAQIGGLDQAYRNASDAVSMVQTAEGALTEMNTTLNSIRSLAVHSANTGSNDATAIAADQTAVDKAIESIQRIATTTKYAGKNLLDGSAGITVTESATTALTSATAGTVVAASGSVSAVITTAAATASATLTVSNFAGGSTTSSGNISMWISIGGTAGTAINVNYASSITSTAFVSNINTALAGAGFYASSNASTTLTLYSSGLGTGLVVAASIVTVAASTNISGTGIDIAGTFGETALSGSGLVLYGSSASAWAGTQLAFKTANNVVGSAATLSVVSGIKFALTQDASSATQISYAISNTQTSKIGVVSALAGSTLDSIKSGGTYNLATNASDAVVIIDQAIYDVSNARAKLGSFQKFTLESTLNNLGVARENLSASESRIRDVDMAQEMMNFTKNQILVQAGTAMLAQANQLPQSVLQLLK